MIGKSLSPSSKNGKMNIVELTKPVIKKIELLAKENGLKLRYIFDEIGEKRMVMVDESKYQTVLTSLLRNSIKFTKQGEIKVRQRLSDGFIETLVEDTGIGISEEKQTQLFQKFHQAMEKTLTRDAGGTGLGTGDTVSKVP